MSLAEKRRRAVRQGQRRGRFKPKPLVKGCVFRVGIFEIGGRAVFIRALQPFADETPAKTFSLGAFPDANGEEIVMRRLRVIFRQHRRRLERASD